MQQFSLSSVLDQVGLRLLPVQERGTNGNARGFGQEVQTDVSTQRNTTTIEVGQLGTKDAKTIVLYLSNADKSNAGQTKADQADTELVLWDCASPTLKKEALRRALDPLHLLRRVEAQMERHLEQVKAACSCCLACEPQGA